MPPRLRLIYLGICLVSVMIPTVALLSELKRSETWCIPTAGGRLPWLLFYAAACGAGLVLLLIVASGRLAYRGELPKES